MRINLIKIIRLCASIYKCFCCCCFNEMHISCTLGYDLWFIWCWLLSSKSLETKRNPGVRIVWLAGKRRSGMKISGSKCNTYPRPRSFAGHRPNLRHSTAPGTREINRCDKLLAICLGESSSFETTCRGGIDLRDLGKISLTLFVDYAKH